MPSRACPSCQAPLNVDQVQCPRCGARDDPNEPLHASDGSDTANFAAPDAKRIPVVEGSLDLARLALTSFEGYIVSLVDGLADIETVAQIAGLQTIEMQSLLQSLADRGVLRMVEPAAPPKAVLGRMATAKVVTFRQPSKPSATELPPLQKAIDLETKGDLKAAIRVLEAALKGSTEPAPLYNRLALILVKDRNDLKQAESLLRRAIELAPTRDLYQRNLAKVLELSAKRPPRA